MPDRSTKVEVLDVAKTSDAELWYKVRLPHGTVGYVESKHIGKEKPKTTTIPIDLYEGHYVVGDEVYKAMFSVRTDIREKITNYTFHYKLSNGFTRVLHTKINGNMIIVTGSFDAMPKMAPINIGVLDEQHIDIINDSLGRKLWKARERAVKTSSYDKVVDNQW